MPLDIGALRHRLELQRETITTDSNGDQDKEWTTFDTVWAAIAPLSAREFVASGQSESEVMARITREATNIKDAAGEIVRVLQRGQQFVIVTQLGDDG